MTFTFDCNPRFSVGTRVAVKIGDDGEVGVGVVLERRTPMTRQGNWVYLVRLTEIIGGSSSIEPVSVLKTEKHLQSIEEATASKLMGKPVFP